MKFSMLFLVLFLGFVEVSAQQKLEKVGPDRYELRFASLSPAGAHLSANDFAREVGNLLKEQYPAKVLEPKVSLSIGTSWGEVSYQFSWSCRIVKTTPEKADYYFDRRGTMGYAKTLKEAQFQVDAEIVRSGKVHRLQQTFPRGIIYNTFVKKVFVYSKQDNDWWCLKEYFLVAPK